MLTHNVSSVRRRLRMFYQRRLLIFVLICCSIFLFSYINLEFCYKLLANNSLNSMCNRYKAKKYSGILCEELCNGKTFKEFKCPDTGLKATLFTAVKNHDVYAFKMAKFIPETITWEDKDGEVHYPKMDDFTNIVKRNFIIEYNVTIDDDTIKALLNQEIDPNSPDQMNSIWRLFKDNNYVMGKLFEEESLFPIIFGSCGPIYATEQLKHIQPETGIRQYITIDWVGRLKFAIVILEYLYRLEQIKPEPLKICKIDTQDFGISVDKRIKYRSANYIQPQSQMDKILSDGSHCTADTDCFHQHCTGKCDTNLHICTGIQQNNNLQIVCQHIFKGNRYFPGILSTTKTPANLSSLIDICIDPSLNTKYRHQERRLAPTNELAMLLYNEVKRLYNEVTFHQ